MSYEVQQALDEIMELPPMFRRDFIIDYIRKNLTRDEAKAILLKKAGTDYIERTVKQGYITRDELLEQIGPERVKKYFHIISTRS